MSDQATLHAELPFAGQHAIVMGLGFSGLAMARWCAYWGARVTVIDTRAQPPELASLARLLPQAEFQQVEFSTGQSNGVEVWLGQRSGENGLRPSMLLLSPGLSPSQTEPLSQAMQAYGAWVAGEVSLFEHALAQLERSQAYKPQLIGVTGTNGKTTVTMLCAHLLKRCGRAAVAAGNVGDCMLDVLRERVLANALPQVWVLELSSFQLHGNAVRLDAATVLNLSEDHLDWHGDMASYAAAKSRIFDRAGLALFNRDDAAVAAMLAPSPKSNDRRIRVPENKLAALPKQSFSATLPQRAGDWGLEQVNGMTWLVRAQAAEDAPRRRKSGAVEELSMQRLMPADALRIRGQHNALNALAALALCHALQMPLAQMLYGLREYAGEPHRCVSVGVHEGVEYINDSKGTNVGAALAAIQSVGEDKAVGAQQRLVVILGGVGKGQHFGPLAPALLRYGKAIVLMGADAAALYEQVVQVQGAEQSTPAVNASSMSEAVRRAHALAAPGDAVLLSPACASFDMFKGYADRGDQFAAAFTALAEGHSEPA